MAKSPAGHPRMLLIERPRLTRLLTESPGRIKLLVATAGFGKTTLVRQWLMQGGRRAAWIRCTQSTADVAVLIDQLTEAASHLSGRGTRRTSDRLRAASNPATELALFLDLLVEDMASWPHDAWVVLDDYQELMTSDVSENLLEDLLERTRLNLVVASRRRPTWATSRRLFYGEVSALNASQLAMTTGEAQELLGERAEMASELVSATEGWPALIALASMSDDLRLPDSVARSALFDFIAHEVFSTVDGASRDALTEVALAPRHHGSLLRSLYGSTAASVIQQKALSSGILSETLTGDVELHPLVQQFLSRGQHNHHTDSTIERLWEVLSRDHQWDDIFSILLRSGRLQHLPRLLNESLDALLNAGRSLSLKRWVDMAIAHDVDAPIVKLAEAEISLRFGAHARAEAIAIEAAEGFVLDSDRAGRCLCVAGQAAHLQHQEDAAISHFSRAQARAESAEVQQTALWGRFVSSVDLESDDAEAIMREVVANEPPTPAGVVKRANARLIYELRLGGVRSLREARLATQVIDRVTDPVRRAGFWSVYSSALALSGFYGQALQEGGRFLADVKHSRVDFALPYAHAVLAIALLGQQRYGEAAAAANDASNGAEHLGDDHAFANAAAIRSRIHLSQGDFEAALDCLAVPFAETMTRGMVGEVLACRAVVLACLTDPSYARAASDATSMTRSLETRVLVPVAHAVYESLTNETNSRSTVAKLVDTAKETASWDCFVCGYRAHPELLARLRGDTLRSQVLGPVLRRAGDERFEPLLGSADRGRRQQLTPRELEIHALLSLGLTNREIAHRLVVSESTVKLHVHHILKKLAVKTRTAAAARYREEGREAATDGDLAGKSTAS